MLDKRLVEITGIMLFAGALLMIGASPAEGALIVQDGSFNNVGPKQTDALPPNGYYNPTSWTQLNTDVKQRNCILDYIFEDMSATDGANWVRLATGEYAGVYQTLGQFDSVGDQVSIVADGLFNTSLSSPFTNDGLIMSLRRVSVGGAVLATFTLTEDNSTIAYADGLSLNYTAEAADIGQDIILLIEPAGDFVRSGVDNVRLTYAPIPEPATLGMLGLSAIGVLVRRRRRG